MSGQCPSCGAASVDDLLCHADSAAVEGMLAAVPQLVEQLDVAISRQAKVGGGGKAGKGSVHERSPVNFGALAAKDDLLVAVAFVGDDINALRRHPQVYELVLNLGKAVKGAYRCIDRAQDRQYLGRCYADTAGEECQAELWARPTAVDVTCRLCGHVHIVAHRRLDMLDMARDVICTVREASSYVGEVGGIVVTETRIRNWINRRRIVVRPGPTAERHIRLGDLLAVVADESTSRTA